MIEIREPKFKVGDKVTTPQEGKKAVGTIEGIKFYDFSKGTYMYIVGLEKDGFTDKQYIDELVLDIYVENPKSVWGLKKGDNYYIVDIDGGVTQEIWWDDYDEKSYINSGNVFLTEEEAEFEVERRKIETEMLRLGGRREFKKGENNWFIYYNDGLNVMVLYDSIAQGAICFDSENEAYNAIKKIGKSRIKKYIFGVNE